MQITANYASTCPGCGQRIQVGQFVEWTKGQKARCLPCARRPAETNVAYTGPSKICPNPRDCGDPSCAGDCGY